MAISNSTIKNAVKSMMESMASTDLDQASAIDTIAQQWADIIEDAIKSADVTGVQTTVTTTGSATAQTGTGIQNNTGSLS